VGHGRELRIAGNPVHSGNDAGVGTGAVTAQNANGVQGGLLGYAISGAGHRATDVRAVTVTVGPAAAVVDGGIAVTHATAEFVVRAEQAGIDDVAVHVAGSGGVGVGSAQGTATLIDTIQAPGRVVLGGADRDDAVFLDVGDTVVFKQLGYGPRAGLDDETGQHVLVGHLDLCTVCARHADGR